MTNALNTHVKAEAMFITQHYVSRPLTFKDKQSKMEQTGYNFMKTHKKSN